MEVTQCPEPREAWRQHLPKGLDPLSGALTILGSKATRVGDLGTMASGSIGTCSATRGSTGGRSQARAASVEGLRCPWVPQLSWAQEDSPAQRFTARAHCASAHTWRTPGGTGVAVVA